MNSARDSRTLITLFYSDTPRRERLLVLIVHFFSLLLQQTDCHHNVSRPRSAGAIRGRASALWTAFAYNARSALVTPVREVFASADVDSSLDPAGVTLDGEIHRVRLRRRDF